jgi:hypothetical protein
MRCARNYLDMKLQPQVARIVWYQNLGFLGILILSFLDELIEMRSLVFSDHPWAFLLARPTLEILLTLGVWYLVNTSTRRILEHLHYLEQFLRVCAWCRRIHYKEEWMRLEEFMRQGFDTPTTHGICPECFQQQKAAIHAARLAQQNQSPLAGQK